MAARPAESICAICLDFFTEPVVTECGHNFCRACIKTCLEEKAGSKFSCPQCRQICSRYTMKPNRLLVSLVEAAKQLGVTETPQLQGGSVCELHSEQLKLYCHDDEKLICVVCDRSREHRYHSVLPVEEAAEDCKKSFQINLVDLKSKLEGLLTCRRNDEEILTFLKSDIETQRTHIKSEMEYLHNFLKDQEEMLLCKLVVVETSLSKIDTKSSEQIDRLNELIHKIEASCQQPAKEIMKDAKDLLARIHEELQEESKMAAQCEAAMPRDTHGAPNCPRSPEEVYDDCIRSPVELYEEPYEYARTLEKHSEDSDEDMMYSKKLGALFGDGSDDETKKATASHTISRKKSSKKWLKFFTGRHSNSDKKKTPGSATVGHAPGKKAKVIFDYKAVDENDLSIVQGDIITDIDVIDEAWWCGYCKGKYGVFPASFVALL